MSNGSRRGSRKGTKHNRRAPRAGGKRNAVGERVRSKRMAVDLTQEALAARCTLHGWDVDRQIVAHIEAGSREVNDLELVVLCRVLRTTPNELLGWYEPLDEQWTAG